MNSEVPLFPCDFIYEAYLDTRVAATPSIADTVEDVPRGGGGEQLLALVVWDSLKLVGGTVVGPQEHVVSNVFCDEIICIEIRQHHKQSHQASNKSSSIGTVQVRWGATLPEDAWTGVDATVEPFKVRYRELALHLIIGT